MRLGRELENYAVAEIAAFCSGVVEVSLTIHDQATDGIGPIGLLLGEGMQYGLFVSGVDLEHRAASALARVRCAAGKGRAIEVSLRIHKECPTLGVDAVILRAKAVPHRLLAAGAQLEDRSLPEGSAREGRAVKVALRVDDQTCEGV